MMDRDTFKSFTSRMMDNDRMRSLAERAGLQSLGSAVRVIGPYQATGAFVRRAWAEANSATLERYIQAYVEALRWAMAPAHRDAAVRLVSRLAPGSHALG